MVKNRINSKFVDMANSMLSSRASEKVERLVRELIPESLSIWDAATENLPAPFRREYREDRKSTKN